MAVLHTPTRREKDLDSRIRAFKTSDPMVRLTRDQLHLIVEECTRLQELNKQRCAQVDLQQRQRAVVGGGEDRRGDEASAGGSRGGSRLSSSARQRLEGGG